MDNSPLYKIDIDASGSIYLTPVDAGNARNFTSDEIKGVLSSPRKRLKKAIAAKRSSTIEDAQIEALGRVFEEMAGVAQRITESLEQSHRIVTDMISDVRAIKSTSA